MVEYPPPPSHVRWYTAASHAGLTTMLQSVARLPTLTILTVTSTFKFGLPNNGLQLSLYLPNPLPHPMTTTSAGLIKIKFGYHLHNMYYLDTRERLITQRICVYMHKDKKTVYLQQSYRLRNCALTQSHTAHTHRETAITQI